MALHYRDFLKDLYNAAICYKLRTDFELHTIIFNKTVRNHARIFTISIDLLVVNIFEIFIIHVHFILLLCNKESKCTPVAKFIFYMKLKYMYKILNLRRINIISSYDIRVNFLLSFPMESHLQLSHQNSFQQIEIS